MTALLAAVPTVAWMAGLLAGSIGGLCVALGGADRTVTAVRTMSPAADPAVTCPDLDDVPWDRAALDDDPIWANGRAVAS